MTSIRVVRQSYVWVVISLLLFMMLIGVGCYFARKQSVAINQLIVNKNTIETSITSLEESVKGLNHYPSYKKKLAQHVTKLNAYNDPSAKKFIATVIADIAHQAPPTLFLSELAVTKQIALGGFAHNIQSVLDLLNNLLHLPYICNGKIVKLKTAAYQNSLLEFLIKLEMKPCKENYG